MMADGLARPDVRDKQGGDCAPWEHAMINVRRIGYTVLETPEVERQIGYYTEILGLKLVGRDNGRAFLATKQGQQAIVLEQGKQPRCTRLGFQVAPDTELKDVARQLAAAGIKSELRNSSTPGTETLLAFEDPKGTILEIFAEEKMLPVEQQLYGIGPLKLGHVAFHVRDIQKIVEFYQEILGFRVSDWRADFFVFMRCGPDHHTVNFVEHGDVVKLHHMAFEVKDWGEILRACDYLGANDIHLIWGPGRHIIGHNIFIYHRNPDRQIIECYTGLDQMKDEALGYFEPRPWHQDQPQRPKVWPADTLGSYWGGRPPIGFGD
jgi:catechol 2,3-dioxygenase-like lactoylglutathione lyase family enzyme